MKRLLVVIAILLALLAGLLIAARPAHAWDRPVYGTGVDYSWSHPDPQWIVDSGYVGVVRYLSWDNTGKNITPGERDSLWSAGLPIALNWESAANRPLQGGSAGWDDGYEAGRQADALGWPTDRPIYYSLDTSYTGDQFQAVFDYLDAARTSSGRPVGLYAGADLIDAAYEQGHIQYGWVTGAKSWSNGAWPYNAELPFVAHANLVQMLGYVLNDSSDWDVFTWPDWGQFIPGGQFSSPVPTPSPEPLPPSTPIPTVFSIGSTDPYVKVIQGTVNRYGCGPITVDGQYGPATAQGVACLQTLIGIGADGTWGPQTGTVVDQVDAYLAILNGTPAPAPAIDPGALAFIDDCTHTILRQGDVDGCVPLAQELLANRGGWLTVDGQFGAITAVNVARLEEVNGLTVDSTIGSMVWGVLVS